MIQSRIPFRVTNKEPVELNSTKPIPILGFGFWGSGRKIGIAQGVLCNSSKN